MGTTRKKLRQLPLNAAQPHRVIIFIAAVNPAGMAASLKAAIPQIKKHRKPQTYGTPRLPGE